MKVGEFFIQLGVLSDKKSVKDFAGAIGDMSIDAAAGVGALLGLEYELVKVAAEAMNAAVGFEMFQSETGLSWKELQKWQIVGAQVNVTADTISSSVTALAKNLAELRLGRGNRAPFQMLGVDTSGDAFTVLSRIRERIRALNLDRPTASNMLSQMGISPDMLRLIELTDSQFKNLSGTIRGMTDDEEQKFYRSKQSIIQWGLVLKQYGIDLVYHLMVLLEKFVGYINSIPGNLGLLIASLALLAAAFFPITAAVVGLILLFDDLSVYLSGGDSMIGRAIEGLKKFGAELKNAFDVGNLGRVMDLLHVGATGPMGMLATGAVKGAQSIIQNNNIHVTGTDPVSISQEIIRQISRHMGSAEQQVNNQGH